MRRLQQMSLPQNGEPSKGVAVVVGVGPGFGEAAAYRFAQADMPVAMLARRNSNDLLRQLRSENRRAEAYPCDATDELAVTAVFSAIERELGPVKLVVYAVQGFGPGRTVDIEVAAFEESWRQNCLGGFIVGRQAARSMMATGGGTIIFVGATSALVGRAGYLNLAVGKFGLRALSQVMARELGEQGIHVVHLVIDGHIDDGEPLESGEAYMAPADIAALLHQLHMQPRGTWTHELDIRPWKEKFWEHC